MCGICGHSNDPAGQIVREMNARMVARGPDDEGIYADPGSGAALGARRLSILDVEGGHQPLANEDGSVWACLNGEIYNYPALRSRLLARGHQLRTGTDTEVLVHLYEDYGPRLVHALEGMYAFAIWDSSKEAFLLGRDRFGEKPLFYSEDGGSLAFASELTALREGAGLPDELEPGSIDAYFVLGYVPGPASIVRGVRQLPPASTLWWGRDDRCARLNTYWEPPPVPADASAPAGEELMAELEVLFDRAVEGRLLSDVPVGVFLSGGTDSMLTAGFAARHSTSSVKTFTVDYDVGEVGEAPIAREVAQRIGAEHHELLLAQDELAETAPGLLAGLDQPLGDQALVALHAVSEFARLEVKVALGGEGADELFGGYPRYRWLAASQRVQAAVPRPLGRAAAGVIGAVPRSTAARRLATVVGPEPMLDRHLEWVTFGRRQARAALYGPALRSTLTDGSLPLRVPDLGGRDPAAALMRLDLAYWLPDDVLAKADRASMRSSLEMRTPFLSRELAEFAAGVPSDVHLRGRGKRLLRGLVRKTFPDVDPNRRKTAFRVPAAAWLRGPLAPVLDRQLERGQMFAEGWFERQEVARLRGEHVAGKDHSAALWPLLAFGLWLDRMRGADGR